MRTRLHRPSTWVAAYAVLVALVVALVSHPAANNIDGNIYLEMARALWTTGSLEVPNGLERVHSVELWILNTVEVDGRLVAKYPPLYAALAAPVWALTGVSGLIGLNALGVGLAVWASHRLALRLIPPRWALVAALTLPVCTPLLPYGMVVRPHALATGLLLCGLVGAWWAVEADSRRDEVLRGLVGGVLLALAVGVRIQEVVPVVVILAWILALGRGWAAAMVALPLAGVLGALSAINQARYGSPDPFSYGPPGRWGAPVEVERIGHLVGQPGSWLVLAVACVVVLVALWTRGRRHRRAVVAATALAGLVVVLAVGASRQALVDRLASTWVLLVDASLLHGGWMEPLRFHARITKSLLQCNPFLVVGVGAAVVHTARLRPGPALLPSVICVAVVGFLSLRQWSDLLGLGDVLGHVTYGPRYLVGVQSLVYLLGLHALHGLRWHRDAVFGGGVLGLWAIVGVVASGEWVHDVVILYGSVGLALVLAVLVWLFRSGRLTAGAVAVVVVAANVYAAAVTLAEDTSITWRIGRLHAGWVATLDEVLPDPVVLVGWGGAAHGMHGIRDHRRAILVDASHDRGEDLVRVLGAFAEEGMPAYAFGLGVGQVRPRLAGHYRYERVLHSPSLWRLVPVGPDG